MTKTLKEQIIDNLWFTVNALIIIIGALLIGKWAVGLVFVIFGILSELIKINHD